MKLFTFSLFLILHLILVLATVSDAGMIKDHQSIQGTFTSVAQVNNQCMECHKQQADDVRKSIHWRWQRQRIINGKTVLSSKDKDLSRFAVAAGSNIKVCHRCHISTLPASAATVAPPAATTINCLVCHDTTGRYKSGVHLDELEEIARKAGRASVRNCRICHERQCGLSPNNHQTAAGDVHLQKYGFTCWTCHPGGGHHLFRRTMIRNPQRPEARGCASCHGQKIHTLARLNRHALLIGCQSCHIPVYGDKHPVVVSWNWPATDSSYNLYSRNNSVISSGGFLQGSEIRPLYLWDDGSDTLYTRGDRVQPGHITILQGPGPRSPTSKIMPFSIQYGIQLEDRKFHYLLSPLLARQRAPFWKTTELQEAVTAGMRAILLPYSGESSTAVTVSLRRINHGVKPVDKALDCMDCHGSASRFSWRKLGYRQDPWIGGRENRQPPPATMNTPSIGLPPVEESVLPVMPKIPVIPVR